MAKYVCGECRWFDWESYEERGDGMGECLNLNQHFGTVVPDWEACELWEPEEWEPEEEDDEEVLT